MRLASKALPSLVTFFIGVGAMYIANVLITRYAGEALVADWATLNSFMMVGGAFALFGFDQQLIREPQAAKLIARTAVFNVSLIAVLGGLIGLRFGYTPSFFVGAFVIVGFAVSALCFQWWRTNLHMTAAYMANGTWRLAFLIGVVLLFITDKAPLSQILIGAFLIGFCVLGFLFLRLKPRADLVAIHSDITKTKDVYLIGSSYFMAALSLAIASYGESLVVRTIGSTADVALYFKSLVLFLFPGVMFNQYVAAIVGPTLRQNEARAINYLRRYKLLIIGALLLIWPALIAAGYILGRLIYGSYFTPPALAALLAFTACMRLIYILPSNFVGITANKKQLRWISAAYLGFALMFPLMSWGLAEAGLAVIFAVATANLINWTLRTLAGLSIVKQRFALYPITAKAS